MPGLPGPPGKDGHDGLQGPKGEPGECADGGGRAREGTDHNEADLGAKDINLMAKSVASPATPAPRTEFNPVAGLALLSSKPGSSMPSAPLLLYFLV